MPFYKRIMVSCLCLVACIACHQEFNTRRASTGELDDTKLMHVVEDLLELKPAEGLVYYNNIPFTGFAVTFYNDEFFTSKVRYVDGVRHGLSRKRFDDGSLSYEAIYVDGRLHGNVSTWWRNGNKRSQANYDHGVATGDQWQWYSSGAKFKRIHLANGREEGLQQSWRENGKLYNNYEAKNGRIFGLKRSKLCFQLDNEIVQYAPD